MRTRTGCVTCRTRHLKCDEAKPTCNRCMRGKRECIQADPATNFRYVFASAGGLESSPRSQKKAEPAKHSTFIADNCSTTAHRPVHTQEVGSSPGILEKHFCPFVTQDEGQLAPMSQPHLRAEPSSERSFDDDLDATLSTVPFEPMVTCIIPDTPSYHALSPESSNSIRIAGGTAVAELPALVELPRENTGVMCHEHAVLFRFFKDYWGPGLDSQDANRHFTIEVPQRAQHTPVLLNAILAVSSLHQSKLSGSSIVVAEQYHEACVKLILGMLNHADAHIDELLLVTTVILRVYEQMNGSFTDDECHLLGAAALASAQAATSGRLWKAAFWVYLRQDVYMAILDQRPIKTDLSICTLWKSEVPTNDCEWSQVIMLIVADIIGFCFSSHCEDPAETWASLRERLDKWSFCRPASFEPYYSSERNLVAGRHFPDIWLSEQCHVTAMIYYHMGHALLLIYDPDHAVGINARRQQKALEVEVAHHAHTICGICLSNSTTETRRTACYAMFLCCRYITDPKEQQVILDILQQTEVEDLWPTARISRVLREEWDMIC